MSDKIIARYRHIAKLPDWLFGFTFSLRHRAIEKLQLKAGDRVVDVGCGTGPNFPLLLEAVGGSGEVVGFDLSPDMRGTTMLKKRPLLAYFILAYVLTWTGSLFYYFSIPQNGSAIPSFLSFPGAVIWYYGPFLAAVIVTGTNGDRDSVRRLLKRLLIWQVGWIWYAFIILYPLILHLTVAWLNRTFGGPGLRFFQAEGVPTGNVWLTLLGLIVLHTFLRGIGEETGWRGFALPRMQSNRSAFSASLMLGLLWALWHFHPANFSALLSSRAVFFILNVIGTTVIFTWVYNHTHGSLFIAVLFHMTLNVAEYVIPIGIVGMDLLQNLFQVSIIWLVVVLLVFRSGLQLGQGNLRESSITAA